MASGALLRGYSRGLSNAMWTDRTKTEGGISSQRRREHYLQDSSAIGLVCSEKEEETSFTHSETRVNRISPNPKNRNR